MEQNCQQVQGSEGNCSEKHADLHFSDHHLVVHAGLRVVVIQELAIGSLHNKMTPDMMGSSSSTQMDRLKQKDKLRQMGSPSHHSSMV